MYGFKIILVENESNLEQNHIDRVFEKVAKSKQFTLTLGTNVKLYLMNNII